MRQPELTLDFKVGDILNDYHTGQWRIKSVDYDNSQITVTKWSPVIYPDVASSYVISMQEALKWWASRDGECIRNPWSHP